MKKISKIICVILLCFVTQINALAINLFDTDTQDDNPFLLTSEEFRDMQAQGIRIVGVIDSNGIYRAPIIYGEIENGTFARTYTEEFNTIITPEYGTDNYNVQILYRQ